MGKLLKYEIKGNFKFIAAVIITMSLISILLLSRIGVWDSDTIGGLMGLTGFGAFITVLLYVINCFKKEFYDERGYLTFTLPISGNKILGAKLITSLIWLFVTGIVFVIFLSIFGKYQFDINFSVLKELRAQHIQQLLITMVVGLMQTIIFMLMVYFSIVISKIALKSKKIGGFISFIIFIAINTLFWYVFYKLVNAFPNVLSIGSSAGNTSHTIAQGSVITFRGAGVEINIIGLIYSIVFGIGLFLGTGYFIDNKIDL